MKKSRGTRHKVPIVFLVLAFTLICSLSVTAQDKLLSNSTTNSSVANPPAVNCSEYAADGSCKAGQYFRSDGLVPSSTWTPTATASAFGAWATLGATAAPVNSCASCHHDKLDSATNGMSYIVGGHKNILRKVVPGQPMLNSEGDVVSTVVDHAGGIWSMDWATGTAGGNRAYYLAGWIPEPDLFGDFGQTTSGIPYGSCGRCHTTGYRYDDNGPEPTLYDPNANTYTKLTTAQFPRVPAGGKTATGDSTGVNGPAGSWYLTGIQCERCHKADMQYDASVINPQYNAGTSSAPNPTSTAGRVNHMTKVYVDPSNVGDCTWSASRNRSNCTLLAPVTLGDFTIGSAEAVAGTSTNVRGNGTFIGRPVPKAPYGLLCVECHQAYSTWTAKTAGTVGETHTTPLPGFESLVPAMDTTKFTTTKAATGQFSASFACSVAGKTTYTDCVNGGGTVTYKPGGMSHGAVATILNSPHARVTGYVDAKTPASADSTLIIKGGTLTDGTVVTGKFNTHFSSELGVAGSCMGCHNVHGYLEGYVETNAVNTGGEKLKQCTECHSSHAGPVAHPKGPGTPFADGNYGSQESCSTCHFAKKTGTEYHFLRINPDPNYNTFPSAQAYYTSPGSGKFGKLNTYDSGETYQDGATPPNTKTYPAVALDVDIACGQCHIGGNGDKNVNGGGNPYGLTPPAPVPGGMTPAAYSRAFLAEKAIAMHNTNAPAPTFNPPYPYSGAPTTVTISDSGMSEGSAVTIFYTTDGTAPAAVVSGFAYAPKPGTTTQQCANPCTVTVNSSQTIYALAAGPQSFGFTPSVAAGGAYNIPTLAKPTFLPSAGNYTTPTASVSLSGPFGATLFYTKDGTTPNTSAGGSTFQYTAGTPVVLNSYTILKAIATAPGYAPSAVATSGAYTFKLATPTFSNVGAKYPGSYSLAANGGSVTVKLNDANAAAAICYTTNGTTPTAAAGVCTNGTSMAAGGTFTLSSPGLTTVRAIAVAPSYTNSNMVSGSYSLY